MPGFLILVITVFDYSSLKHIQIHQDSHEGPEHPLQGIIKDQMNMSRNGQIA